MDPKRKSSITWPYFIALKNSKYHLIPHVIPVKMIYKRSHANKMAAERFRNEDGFAEKEGTVIHRFIYGEFFNI